jgi:predicted transcriptional regulator
VERDMTQLKEAAIETIKKLPDECTIDDIMYEINFVGQVLEGVQDADEGKVITTEELLKKVGEWSK